MILTFAFVHLLSVVFPKNGYMLDAVLLINFMQVCMMRSLLTSLLLHSNMTIEGSVFLVITYKTSTQYSMVLPHDERWSILPVYTLPLLGNVDTGNKPQLPYVYSLQLIPLVTELWIPLTGTSTLCGQWAD